MNNHMNRDVRTRLILTTLIVVAVVVVAVVVALWATSTFWLPSYPFRYRLPPPQYVPPSEDIELFYTVETVFSTINVTLSIVLLLTYVNIYRKTRSEFTIGLTIFSAVFLLNALASSPLFRGAFGYRPFGLGPFTMLPDVFTFGALLVLLYLSVRY
jgi:hypothetical protein